MHTPDSDDNTSQLPEAPVPGQPQVNGQGRYGSRASLKEALSLANEEIRTPAQDMRFIYSTAFNLGVTGEEQVRANCAVRFSAENRELTEKCTRRLEFSCAELEGINRHIEELTRILQGTDRYQEAVRQTTPWTRFERLQVIALAIFAGLLLLVGMNNIALLLMASGIQGFESPWRAYLFSFSPLGVAAMLEALRMFIFHRRLRLTYTISVLVTGLVFGISWIILFAKTFPGLTQTTAEIINSLSQTPAPGPSAQTGPLFIVVSILGESILAAGLSMTIMAMVEKHQPWLRVDNPAYTKGQGDLDFWLMRKSEEAEIAGALNGKVLAMTQARERFVDEGMGHFRSALFPAAQAKRFADLFHWQQSPNHNINKNSH